ncbi:histidine phosphatase family protein [Marinibacterium profundimaris]|uniref:Phosphoglycerate mutase n=1 Tax=Marinibacterium profundimaris TaxID=1679460 RepID=A0A225NHT5_9RHOB|nr:histidine phosphatase family protein [Marinibacterium profundimaris]OWU73304.1 phosphoglycerate mutase [Marinibacterium profundimaris]
MTRLFLVRHAPTHAKGMVGWTDLPADLADTPALDRLSAHLPDDALVISSDLTRCVATADALQGDRRRLPHDHGLREIHFGDWELRRFDEIEAEDPDHITAFWREPGPVRPPGGESWHDMRARTDAAVDRLLAAHAGETLVIVAHFGMILGQLERALGVPTTEVFAQKIDNLSVTELEHHPAGWRVGQVNHRP